MDTPLRALPVLCAAVAASLLWLCSATAAEEASQNVEAVAEKVEKGAERTEKAEGKHDTGGEKVIEQVGEASYYGKGFHGKKTAGGEKIRPGRPDGRAPHPPARVGSESDEPGDRGVSGGTN
jgi:hypothetical protein